MNNEIKAKLRIANEQLKPWHESREEAYRRMAENLKELYSRPLTREHGVMAFVSEPPLTINLPQPAHGVVTVNDDSTFQGFAVKVHEPDDSVDFTILATTPAAKTASS